MHWAPLQQKSLPCTHTAEMHFNEYFESLPVPSPEPGVMC